VEWRVDWVGRESANLNDIGRGYGQLLGGDDHNYLISSTKLICGKGAGWNGKGVPAVSKKLQRESFAG